jgi:hypothetical protein
MVPSKISLFVAFFCYAGNGSCASLHPSLRRWWAQTLLKCKTDSRFANRIEEVYDTDITDTPISMTRNLAIRQAREAKADVIIMVDSDQVPDVHLGEPGVKPWFDSSLAFLLEQYDKGKPVAIGAPYCGPPPHENVYVFQWRNFESDDPNLGHQLAQYDREHAAVMAGIMPVAALPTGLIMFDIRLFDLIAPPYFDYEYRDRFRSEKVSTEDVVSTRDMSLVIQHKLGYNPVFCNWDAWAGHAKPKIVGKPRIIEADKVSQRWMQGLQMPNSNMRLMYIGDPTEVLPAALHPTGNGDHSCQPKSDQTQKEAHGPTTPLSKSSSRVWPSLAAAGDRQPSENSPNLSAGNGEALETSSTP